MFRGKQDGNLIPAADAKAATNTPRLAESGQAACSTGMRTAQSAVRAARLLPAAIRMPSGLSQMCTASAQARAKYCSVCLPEIKTGTENRGW